MKKLIGKIFRLMPQNKFFGVIEGLAGFYKNARQRYEQDKNISPEEIKKRGGRYLSVAAIVKNEAAYIAEWMEYHLLTGVEKFYIYDNESDDNLKEVLAPYIKDGIVEYIFWPGKGQQIIAYNNALERFRYDSFWLAFIDIDEFIVPAENTTAEFLRGFEDFNGIEINWLLYGSSGHKTKTEGLVIERFKDRTASDLHVKTICNPRKTLFVYPHHASYICGLSADASKNINIKYFLNRVPRYDKIRINHYFTKSFEEFLDKKSRGQVAPAFAHKQMETDMFYINDSRCVVKNDDIMEKYVPLVKQKIAERFKKPNI